MYVCMYVCVCIYVCMICMYVCMYVCIELGDIPILSLHRDKKLILSFFQKTVGVVKQMHELHAHDRLKEQPLRGLQTCL